MATKTPDQLETLDRNTVTNDDLVLVYDASTGRLKTIKKSEILYGLLTQITGAKIQYGQVVADMTGEDATFSESFTSLAYTILAYGQKAGDPVTITIGTTGGGDKTLGYCTLYPAEDGTTINWLAIGA